MHLRKFFTICGCVTAIALVYIHMQMNIYGLAYDHEAKAKHIRDLVEKNGNATYAILRLKSANHIGAAMLTKDSHMQFVSPDDIVEVTAASSLLTESASQHVGQESEKASPLLSMVTFTKRVDVQGQR